MINKMFLFFITFFYFNLSFTNEALARSKFGASREMSSKPLAKTDNFVISNSKTKNQRSKTSIKESIGFEIKDVLNRFADLNKKIAQIQIEVSDLQKQLVEKSGSLIENKKPFKRASRAELTKTLNVLKSAENRVLNQLALVNNLKKEFNSNNCLKNNKEIKV
jgi:septal ring factor EnvC (AmiA/AmiB activator)